MAKLLKKGVICPYPDGYPVDVEGNEESVTSTGVFIDGNSRWVKFHHAGDGHAASMFSIPASPEFLDDLAKGLRLAAKSLRATGFVGGQT